MQAIELNLLNRPDVVHSLTDNVDFKRNDLVVVAISSAHELATVKGKFEIKPDVEFVKIVRLANADDKRQNCENCKMSRAMLPEIKQEAQKLNLDMKVGFVSISLDKSKIYVNYTADDRVDFRELVKVLSGKYKSRIEMRQIGNRDETKQIGAIGVCGKVVCCKQFLSDFDKVSIKMAKNQNISLNPNKINGMCGRLLCCFKYEDEYYGKMQKKMPKINSLVSTPDGKGTVTNLDFLREIVSVTFTKDDSTEVKKYALSEIGKISKDKYDKDYR